MTNRTGAATTGGGAVENIECKDKNLAKNATAWVRKYPDVLENWQQSDDPFKKAAAETMQELAKGGDA